MKKTALFAVVLVVSAALTTALSTAFARGGGGPTFDELAYKNDGDRNHVLDAYLPAGQGPFPVAIVIHGGRSGDEDALSGPARNLADHGFVGISVDYRDWSHPTWSAQMDDLHAAIDWIRGHASTLKADPHHVAVLGSSMGGFIAAMLATGDPAYRPDVVATWSGKLDLTTFKVANGLILGKDAAKDEKVLVANSPTLRVSGRGAAPWFIANSRCELVPLSQATGMANALAAARIPYQLDVVKPCLHAASYGYIVSDAMIAFFKKWD